MLSSLSAARRATAASIVVVGSVFLGSDARADATASEKATAESLFVDARRLMSAGNFAEACPKLVESQRLDPALGTLLHLADCYERNAQTASAWATFREAESIARSRGERERERLAHEHATALDGRVPFLTVNVSAPPAGTTLDVRRDGEPLRPALWGTPIAVDPGEHRVEATAPGMKRWSSQRIVAVDGGRASVTVPLLEADAPPDAPPASPRAPASNVGPAEAAPGPAPSTSAPARSGHEEGSEDRTQRLLGYGSTGVGAAALVAGIVLKLASSSKHDDAQSHCTPTCDAGGGTSLNQDAKTLATWSTVSLVAGGLLAATGVVLIVTSPSKPPATAWKVGPSLTPGAAGLAVGGGF